MGRDVFYLTSAISYVNAEPHVGTAYEIDRGDFVARYRRLRGDQVHFLTGTDEHGLNVARSLRRARDQTRSSGSTQMEPKWRRSGAALRSRTTTSSERRSGGMRSGSKRSCSGSTIAARSTSARTGALLRLLRGVQAGEGAHRREVPDPPAARRDPGGGQLLLPVVEVSAAAAGPLRVPSRTCASGLPAQRGGVVRAGWAPGLVDLALRHRLGCPASMGPEPRLYVWVDALLNYATAIGFGTDEAEFDAPLARRHPPHRQGHPPVPRGLLAGPAHGRGARGPQDQVWAHGFLYVGRREDVEEPGHGRPSVRAPRHLRRGLLPLLLHARDLASARTATSAGSRWWTATTPTSRTVWGTWPAGCWRCSGRTSTGWCRSRRQRAPSPTCRR